MNNKDIKDYFSIEKLDELYSRAISDITSVEAVVLAIAGIGALIYICTKFWKGWASGESINFYSLFRPLVIGFVIINYSFLPAFLDVCLSPINIATESLKEISIEEYEQKVQTYNDKKEELENKNKSEQTGFSVISFFDSLPTIINNFCNETFWWGVEKVLNFFLIIITVGILILSTVTKIILVLLGPFVLALAIFPGYEGALKVWISRYINVSLWLPIANLIGYCVNTFYIVCLYDPFIKTLNEGTLDLEGSNLINLVFTACVIFMYMQVPSIAGWIIESGGTSMTAAAVGGFSGGIAASGSKKAGSAMGQAAGAGISKVSKIGSSSSN